VKQKWVVKPPPPLNEHEVAYIELGRMKAWVDRKLVRLIYACWKRGWETEMCCEEIFPGMAQIEFRRFPYVKEFAEAVAIADVDWDVIEEAVQTQAHGDALWMFQYGYQLDGRSLWVSEMMNSVLFPLAFTPMFLSCITKE